jgi:hypothetical protein
MVSLMDPNKYLEEKKLSIMQISLKRYKKKAGYPNLFSEAAKTKKSTKTENYRLVH